MGIVIRQSAISTALSYAGVVIGYVNLLILFPRYMSPEEVGLARIIQDAAMLMVPFAQLGTDPEEPHRSQVDSGVSGGGHLVKDGDPVWHVRVDAHRQLEGSIADGGIGDGNPHHWISIAHVVLLRLRS